MLALAGLSVGGGLGTLVVPASDHGVTLGPNGSGLVLDPLFSTEAVSLEPDSVAPSRVEKGLWLARERPDLLAELKVCFHENRPDNCGRCSKCLVTMVSLEAAGALELAEEFPPLDGEALAILREPLLGWFSFAEAAHALDPRRHAALRDAVLSGVRRSRRESPIPPSGDTPAFRYRQITKFRTFVFD
jgi:hypothetical protein